ncbi:hypothetical protein J8J32_22165, partial [Mycobacterium tuberculosis]|nr:hypothetical protein [Mycobacterium tuberculosis]
PVSFTHDASQTGTDRASMPDEQSEEPPRPDLRSKLTLPTQRQQQFPFFSPTSDLACIAGGFALAFPAASARHVVP